MEENVRNPKIQKYIDREKGIAETIRKQIQFTRDYHETGVNAPQWYDVRRTVIAATTHVPLPEGTLAVHINNLSI
jgi:hypothetical protein